MLQLSLTTLLDESAAVGQSIAMATESLAFDDCVRATCLAERFASLEGKSVVLMAGSQLRTAAALIELDGWARRMVICPPDLEPERLSAVMRDAQADALVYGGDRPPPGETGDALLVACELSKRRRDQRALRLLETEWVMLTSGTTGDPKLVVHTLETLTGAIGPRSEAAPAPHWATFYDIRRYGGLQIFLRAIKARGSLTLRSHDESLDDFLKRAGDAGVTHISGTPSHWRFALMSPAARRLSPSYVRLSGEIADAAILDALSAFYPHARVSHAYASTEAGVAFEVDDGHPGFPAALLSEPADGVAMKLVEGALAIRSNRTAVRFLGEGAAALRDADGFVDTGDMIERRGERCFFMGRRGGIINVGGAKVNPEEVEAVINQHPSVRMSLVKARKNPITGAVVVADVVLMDAAAASPALKDEIIRACERRLAPYKSPALVRFVASLAVTATGKLTRE